MSEISSEKGCAGCMRNSPVPSMIGFIIVLFGIGTFTAGFVISKNNLIDKVVESLEVPFYIPYAIVSLVVTYTILSYILAAFSSGYNRKRFFEGFAKVTFGRCCTMFNIISHVMALFLWILCSCAISFCLISSFIVLYRLKSNLPCDLSYYGITNKTLNPDDMTQKDMTNLVIFIGVALGGSLLIVLGYVQMLCCASMNYVGLNDDRYYEVNSCTNGKTDQVLSAF